MLRTISSAFSANVFVLNLVLNLLWRIPATSVRIYAEL